MRTASNYVNTSADDCKVSLHFCTAADLPILREALATCEVYSKKTHIKHLAAKIKKLEKVNAQ